MKILQKLFTVQYLDRIKLISKVEKKINKCEKLGITCIQIYFNQKKSTSLLCRDKAIYRSRQTISQEDLVEFVSLYCGCQVEVNR